MYERFTDRARRVMQLANQEAQRFRHEYIGTEHILLALIQEGSGVAANVLRNFNVDGGKILQEVEALIQSGSDIAAMGNLPPMPRAKHVIEYAMEEARNLRHACVGTEHILVGLLREEDGIASHVLMNLGLQLDTVRAEIGNVLAEPHDWGRQRVADLPPLRPVEGRATRIVEAPAACPECGDSHVVRVLWHPVHVLDQDMEDFKSGKAILGSISEMEGPRWICLHCSPRWSEVHRLAMQDWELQVAKEEAIGAMEFETAAGHRDAQDNLRRRLCQLVKELTKKP